MSAGDTELSELWLHKAKNDLVSAKHLITLDDGPLDTVCFHAQQVAEKALKGFLTHHHTEFPKTHNLVLLLELCLPFIDSLEDYREQFAEMTSYAVESRYPGDFFEPSREEAESSLATAEKIFNFISEKISE